MNHDVHYVCGFFAHQEEVDDVFTKLIAQGLPRERVQIYTYQSPRPTHESSDGSNEVLKDVLVYGTIVATVGFGIGGLVEVALITANLTLFIASPLLAPLLLLGWGASIGATENAKPLFVLIEDAIKNGQIVLVVETQTVAGKNIAQEVINDSIVDDKDINAT
jgi:VIT1/CCC1 family predicted Fe2+/Mn2+ transporter